MPPIRMLRVRETRTQFNRSGVEIYPTVYDPATFDIGDVGEAFLQRLTTAEQRIRLMGNYRPCLYNG
jgi:hypothetical protein